MGFRTIKSKLLFSFFIFLLITLFIILANVWFGMREDRTNQIILTINNINLENQISKKLERDFFSDETINPNFYKSGKSTYLAERKGHISKVKKYLNQLSQTSELQSKNIQSQLKKIIRNINEYETVFDKIIALTITRGFKDYGLEGKMRGYIHNIEREAPKFNLDLAKLLMIRRHEKDFILRKEDEYTAKIQEAIMLLIEDIHNKVFLTTERHKLDTLLQGYQSTFIQLVNTEKEIGFTNDKGFRRQLNQIARTIDTQIAQVTDTVNAQISNIRLQNFFSLVGALLFSILLIVFLAFFITRILSNPVQRLSSSINEVIQNNFSREIEFNAIETRDEIGLLSKDFAFMLNKVQDSLDEIQQKSEKLERKNKLLMDSINYAQKIQQAILPDVLEMSEYFEDHFVIYYPMHTVSGDFYWMEVVEDKIFIAVVDCTGHGVPGAFMSMIGNTLLKEIINEKEVHDPALILEVLDADLRMALRQEKSRINDGMEISLCMIEGITDRSPFFKITFSGAKSSLFYTQNHRVKKLKGTRRAIGGHGENALPAHFFENLILELKKGDCLYLGSDGFFDQPNPKRRRFGTKKFLKSLEEINHLSMPIQKKFLADSLSQHMTRETSLRDDVTLLGIRL